MNQRHSKRASTRTPTSGVHCLLALIVDYRKKHGRWGDKQCLK